MVNRMAGDTQMGRGELTRLAKTTGASLTHLHFVLRGERKPSAKLAIQIAEFLGKPVGELFPGLGEMPEQEMPAAQPANL